MVQTNYTKIHDGIRAIIENDKLSVYEKCLHIEADYLFDLLDEIDRLRKYEAYANQLETVLNLDE